MSGSTDPLLKSMEVPLTDNEMNLLNQEKCPNCQSETIYLHCNEFGHNNLKYYIKCGTCLTDYTVYLEIRHVTHIVTFKNGERIRPCPEKISKQVQSKQNELDSKSEESNT